MTRSLRGSAVRVHDVDKVMTSGKYTSRNSARRKTTLRTIIGLLTGLTLRGPNDFFAAPYSAEEVDKAFSKLHRKRHLGLTGSRRSMSLMLVDLCLTS